jgi:hypothetical protein
MGGNLAIDEVNIIRGALDMTVKTVQKSMTPLEKVYMVSTEDRLDEVGGCRCCCCRCCRCRSRPSASCSHLSTPPVGP